MGNFWDSLTTREPTISDVESQHRAATTCHLGNIAMRLGRELKWDPVAETFIDDAEANRLCQREAMHVLCE